MRQSYYIETVIVISVMLILLQLGNRMKYSDPQLLLRAEDEGDPYWLQQLLRVSQCFDVRLQSVIKYYTT